MSPAVWDLSLSFALSLALSLSLCLFLVSLPFSTSHPLFYFLSLFLWQRADLVQYIIKHLENPL